MVASKCEEGLFERTLNRTPGPRKPVEGGTNFFVNPNLSITLRSAD
jgi:hypothetical protein